MIVVREVFHAKPGMASKMVEVFREQMGEGGALPRNLKIMTDLAGSFNKVVLETEYESLEAFEKEMQAYMKMAKERGKNSPHVDMYTRGKREVYRVW